MRLILKTILTAFCASVISLSMGFSDVAAQSSQEQDVDFMYERRIFLWDVTVSMVGATQYEYHTNEYGEKIANVPNYSRTNPYYGYNQANLKYYNSDGDIFDDTRAKLIELIDGLDETFVSEILVFPYTEDIAEPFWVKSASKEDKEALKAMVMAWDNLNMGRTYTGQCLDKVIKGYFAEDMINRVVLLTDGAPHQDDEPVLRRIFAEWDSRMENSRYSNNRLLYVMLNAEAEKMEPYLDNKRGLEGLGKDQNPADYLSFRMVNPVMTVHLNEISTNDLLQHEVEGAISCKATQGRFGKMDVTCMLECDDNPYIRLASNVAELSEDGRLSVKIAFKELDRKFYSDTFVNGEATVCLTCKVADSCGSVTLENDKIEVKLVARPEPRVTLSLKAK
jgi:hypothetical protein